MKFLLMAVSEKSLVDQRSNLLSIINIIEEINAVGFPALVGNCTVTIMVSRTADEPASIPISLTVRIDQDHLATLPIQLEFQDKTFHRQLVDMQGVVVPHAGVLKFLLTIDNAETASWSILIHAVNPPAAIAPAAAPA